MTEPAGTPLDRSATDVPALERAAAELWGSCQQLREMSDRMVHQAVDPGEPPAGEYVLGLQGSAVRALQGLAEAMEQSCTLLRSAADRYRRSEDQVSLSMRRAGSQGT